MKEATLSCLDVNTCGLHLMGSEYRIRSVKRMTLREKLIVKLE